MCVCAHVGLLSESITYEGKEISKRVKSKKKCYSCANSSLAQTTMETVSKKHQKVMNMDDTFAANFLLGVLQK